MLSNCPNCNLLPCLRRQKPNRRRKNQNWVGGGDLEWGYFIYAYGPVGFGYVYNADFEFNKELF